MHFKKLIGSNSSFLRKTQTQKWAVTEHNRCGICPHGHSIIKFLIYKVLPESITQAVACSTKFYSVHLEQPLTGHMGSTYEIYAHI